MSKNSYIDTEFYVENEGQRLRCLINVHNIKSIKFSTICSFHGDSGGACYDIELFNPISPFVGCEIKSLSISANDYSGFLSKYAKALEVQHANKI